MVASDHDGSRHTQAPAEALAAVRKILDRLDTKLLESDTDHFPKEDDRELRRALRQIDDDRLTRLALDYAVCVRGLTGPMVSRAWKGELAQEAEETHRLFLDRLQRLERLARSPAGRLWMRLQAGLRRLFHRSSPVQRLSAPGESGNHGRVR